MSTLTKKRKAFSDYLLLLALLFCCIILTLDKSYAEETLQGIKLWFFYVLPSLFPYLFLTCILSNLNSLNSVSKRLGFFTKKLFNVNGNSFTAVFLSVLCGYPMGAKVVADLKLLGKLDETESQRAAAFCSTSSPVFLIGSVGNIMTNDFKFGLLMFIGQILSSFIIAVVFSFYKRGAKEKYLQPQLPKNAKTDLFTLGVNSAISSSLFVGAIITLFSIFTLMLTKTKVIYPLSKLFSLIFGGNVTGNGVAIGLFEYTKGLKIITENGVGFFTLPACSFICGFGGLSVIMQSVTFLKTAKIKTAPFIFAKILSAVLCLIFGFIFSFIFYY